MEENQMGEMQQKVYLFKAAPEEDFGDTTNTSLLRQFHNLQQKDTVEQQETTTKDTTISADHGPDILTRPSSSTTTTLVEKQGAEETARTIDHNVTSGSSKDRFITLLNSLKIECQLVPVLVFEYSNLDTLWRHLKQPHQHAGMVLTSPRCVHSITEAIKVHDTSSSPDCSAGEWENGLRNEWESKYIFCVGPSTVSAARQLLTSLKSDLAITGLEAHAESLANKVIEVNSKEAFNAQLLYPCGVQRRDVLLNKLTCEGIACSQCTVYESVKNPSLETTLHFVGEELKNHHDCCQMETVLCFFSPSGVNHVFQYLDPRIVEHQHANIVAIGPTTKTALEDCFSAKGIIKRIYQCQNPTPESLMNVIESIRTKS